MSVSSLVRREKDYKRSDSGGLYIRVAQTGLKLWRYSYRSEANEKLLAFGRYPVASLADVRTLRNSPNNCLQGTTWC